MTPLLFLRKPASKSQNEHQSIRGKIGDKYWGAPRHVWALSGHLGAAPLPPFWPSQIVREVRFVLFLVKPGDRRLA